MRLQTAHAKRSFAHASNALHGRGGRAHCRDDGDPQRVSLAADDDAVFMRLTAARRIDHEIDLPSLHGIQYMRIALIYLVDAPSLDAHLVEPARGAIGSHELKVKLCQIAGNLRHRRFVEVVDADKDDAAFRQGQTGRRLRFNKGMAKARRLPHDLAGGAHFRTEPRIDAGEFLKGEHRFLDEEAVH